MELMPPKDPQIDIEVRKATEESSNQPKFTFVLEERATDFSLTRHFISILRELLRDYSCTCFPEFNCFDLSPSNPLWQFLPRISREAFWLNETHRDLRLLYNATTNVYLIRADVPLCFELYGMLLLDVKPNQSFLHVNSGTGYACTLAAHLVGAHGVNHGVEYRKEHRMQAYLNVDSMRRIHPEIDKEAAMPFYHAEFPKDVLEGKSEFDSVLVTDCFRDMMDVYELKRLLTPDGTLVTALYDFNKNRDNHVYMVVLKRHYAPAEPDNEKVTHVAHRLKVGLFELIPPKIMRQNLNTMSHFEVGRLSPQEASESPLSSLKKLALQACAKQVDPVRSLKRDAQYLLRIIARERLPVDIEDNLSSLEEKFTSFHTRCLQTNEDNFDDQMEPLTRDLANIVDVVEKIGQQIIGGHKYATWRDGLAVLLNLQQGMVLWLLENIYHTVRYHWSDQLFCCFGDLKCIVQMDPPDWDAVSDNASLIFVTDCLLEKFVSIFGGIESGDVLDHQPPWNFHLTYQKRMQRILTRMAARICADVSYIAQLVVIIRSVCEEEKGSTIWWGTVLNGVSARCKEIVSSLKTKALNQPELFESFFDFQSTFYELREPVHRLHSYLDYLMLEGKNYPVTQELSYGFCFIATSALRNLAGNGGSPIVPDPDQLNFVCGEGSLMDSELFSSELAFLMPQPLQDADPLGGVNEFLVRRFLSDLKEVMWISRGLQDELKLCILETYSVSYDREVLKALNVPPEEIALL